MIILSYNFFACNACFITSFEGIINFPLFLNSIKFEILIVDVKKESHIFFITSQFFYYKTTDILYNVFHEGTERP